MHDVKRILVVSRSTKHCQKAVHNGISIAKKYGAELYIVHVIHDPFSLEGWNLPVPSLESEYQRMLHSAKAELDKMIQAEKAQGLAIKELIREGKPVAEVLKIIQEEKIDLMLLLAHQEGHFEHFLFGRTNEEFIRRMPCSIFLIKKEPERAF